MEVPEQMVNVAMALDAIVDAVDEVLADAAGQRLSFAVIAFGPGSASYCSNSAHELMLKNLKLFVQRVEAGEAILPMRAKPNEQ